MANSENLKGHGFHERTAREQREIAIAGGKASGAARRKKADFRKTLNALLTAKIENPEWTPVLESLGLDSTLESAVNAAMIREALSGNVKAYLAIKDVLGQTSKSEEDLKEQNLEIQKLKAELEKQKLENERIRGAMSGEKEGADDDGFLEALNGSAAEDWADEEK